MYNPIYLRSEPGTGNLITFSQFLFIAIHGLIFTSKFGKVSRVIPLRNYLTLVVLFFITSVLNNWVFNFNIPVPLHMIFRSVSLLIHFYISHFLNVVLISGLFNSKYDHGYYNIEKAICPLKISVRFDDHNGYYDLHYNFYRRYTKGKKYTI